MKVVHIITTVNRGGAENHLAALVAEQVKQDLDVAIIYLKGDGYWTKYFETLNVKVLSLELKYYGQITPLVRLTHALKQLSPDIIHAHMPPAELYARLAMLCCLKKFKFIISKHNDEPFYKGFFSAALGKWVAKKAGRVIAISDSVNKYMIQNLSLSQEKVVTVHYGIDTNPYEKLASIDSAKFKAEILGSNDNPMIIGTIARLVPQKSLHTLIDAYANYRKITNKQTKLIIVGNGPLEAELKQLSIDREVDDSIIWLGFREDIPLVLSIFDVFVLTSIYEGFGLVLLEAMAAEKTIIASNVSAIPEIVTPESGYLIPANDVSGFCKAFKEIENDSVREALGRAGYKRAKNHFTLAAMSKKTLTMYDYIVRHSK